MGSNVETETKSGINYYGPYNRSIKYPDELQSYRFQCIDGQCYGLDPGLNAIYVGTEEKLLERLMRKETKAEISPQTAMRQSEVKEMTVTTKTKSKSTTHTFVTADVTVKNVLKLHAEGLSTRSIGKLVNVNHMEVHRIINGQRKML